ncbi:molybdopterin molybdotransferase MoeA [Leucobacter sp. GX24907]
MISVEDHLAWILEHVPLVEPVECALDITGTSLETGTGTGTAAGADPGALGAIAAEDLLSRHDLPLWDNSAMDGYAVRSADIQAARPDAPVVLRLVGEVAAGSSEDPQIPSGCAVRIMTGAPVPSAADTVVPVERTLRLDGAEAGTGAAVASTSAAAERGVWAESLVGIAEAVAVGANIRRQGEDTPAGSPIAGAGERIGAVRLAALAAAGVERALVRRPPRVAVVTTGSELRPAGEHLERGQIAESNTQLLAGLLREAGIERIEVARCTDDAVALSALLAELSERSDVIVTTGGVGPGRHDIARIALDAEPEVRYVRVAMRPGQLQCAGRLEAGGAFIFALPGNPVAAAAAFEMFVRPGLLAMQGALRLHRPRLPAIAEVGWRGKPHLLQVLPVRVGERADGELDCRPSVDPSGVSHAVGGHGTADGYALVPPGRGDVRAGDRVTVILTGTA